MSKILMKTLIVVSLGLCCVMWLLSVEEPASAVEKLGHLPMQLPILSPPFIQGEFKVYELQHGWLVSHDRSVAGLTSVPKPVGN
jgi:hypothetical protein